MLDTGALVSVLDRSQRRHEACVELLESWHGPVVSTEAVLTEATHLLGHTPGGADACVRFFVAGGARLVPPSTAALERCRQLLHKYRDLPMDYADATLVVLAEELDTRRVFTTDRRDFTVYRIRGRRKFDILPRAEG